MGFSLKVGRSSCLLSESDSQRLATWLEAQGKHVEEDFTDVGFDEGFPFSIDCLNESSKKPGEPDFMDDLEIILVHQEISTDWWPILASNVSRALSSRRTLFISHMQPGFSAAMPFRTDRKFLIEAHQPKFAQRMVVKILSLIFRTNATDDMMVMTVDGNPKSVRNLRIGSAPNILEEVEEACRFWGLPESNEKGNELALNLFKTKPEDSDTIGRCYALIVRSFLRYAIEHKHIVWFIK